MFIGMCFIEASLSGPERTCQAKSRERNPGVGERKPAVAGTSSQKKEWVNVRTCCASEGESLLRKASSMCGSSDPVRNILGSSLALGGAILDLSVRLIEPQAGSRKAGT